MTLTRRSLLGVAAAVVLSAGCRPRARPPALDDADGAAVGDAIDAERQLLARYDLAIAQLDAVAAGPLMRARDRHHEHLRALAAQPSPAASASPPAGPNAAPAGSLGDTLRSSVANLQAAALRVRSGTVAALLGSIAAEHAADLATGPRL